MKTTSDNDKDRAAEMEADREHAAMIQELCTYFASHRELGGRDHENDE